MMPLARLGVLCAFLAGLYGCATIGEAMTAKETFAVCRALDTVTTLKIVAEGGRELNPLMRFALKSKLAFVGVQVAAVAVVWHYWPQMGIESKAAVNLIGCVPPLHNLREP
jgi:hypothetical protein